MLDNANTIVCFFVCLFVFVFVFFNSMKHPYMLQKKLVCYHPVFSAICIDVSSY